MELPRMTCSFLSIFPVNRPAKSILFLPPCRLRPSHLPASLRKPRLGQGSWRPVTFDVNPQSNIYRPTQHTYPESSEQYNDESKIGVVGDRFTYIVTSKNANDFAVAVKLAEYPLFHVLIARQQSALSYHTGMVVSRHTFFNSGWAWGILTSRCWV